MNIVCIHNYLLILIHHPYFISRISRFSIPCLGVVSNILNHPFCTTFIVHYETCVIPTGLKDSTRYIQELKELERISELTKVKTKFLKLR